MGHSVSEITRKKISLAKVGIKRTDEQRKRMSDASKGKPKPWMIGRQPSEETRRKLSEAHKKLIGELSCNWQGGKSFEPYSKEFNRRFKMLIRERDEFTCQVCANKDCKLDIHHIDYNKKNNEPYNLVSLCKTCHGKTNGNRQKMEYFFKHRLILLEHISYDESMFDEEYIRKLKELSDSYTKL